MVGFEERWVEKSGALGGGEFGGDEA